MDAIIACVSFGIAIMNSIAVAGVYWRYIRDARNVLYMIRADETGEILISDPLSLAK